MQNQLATARLVWDARRESYVVDQIHVPDHVDPGLVQGFSGRVDFFHSHRKFATEESIRPGHESEPEDINEVEFPVKGGISEISLIDHDGNYRRLVVSPALEIEVTRDLDHECDCGWHVLVALIGYPELRYGLRWYGKAQIIRDVAQKIGGQWLVAQHPIGRKRQESFPDLSRLLATISED